MKKVFAFILFFVSAFILSSEEKAVFTVKAVTGEVQVLSGEEWIDLKKGDTLDSDSVVQTGIKSTLAVSDGHKRTVISALKKGTVEDLVSLKKVEIAMVSEEAGGNTGKGVDTASARANVKPQDNGPEAGFVFNKNEASVEKQKESAVSAFDESSENTENKKASKKAKKQKKTKKTKKSKKNAEASEAAEKLLPSEGQSENENQQ